MEIFALGNDVGGVRVNGIHLNKLWFADGTVLLAENIQELQNTQNNVIQDSQECGLTLNVK